jgi:hypothetical protein
VVEVIRSLHHAAAELLAADSRRGRRRRSLLLAGAEKGGGRHEGKDSDFHVLCVGVNRVVMVPIHQTTGSGIIETNDKFCLCK